MLRKSRVVNEKKRRPGREHTRDQLHLHWRAACLIGPRPRSNLRKRAWAPFFSHPHTGPHSLRLGSETRTRSLWLASPPNVGDVHSFVGDLLSSYSIGVNATRTHASIIKDVGRQSCVRRWDWNAISWVDRAKGMAGALQNGVSHKRGGSQGSKQQARFPRASPSHVPVKRTAQSRIAVCVDLAIQQLNNFRTFETVSVCSLAQV